MELNSNEIALNHKDDVILWQFLCYFMLCKRPIIVKTSKQIVNSIEKAENQIFLYPSIAETAAIRTV